MRYYVVDESGVKTRIKEPEYQRRWETGEFNKYIQLWGHEPANKYTAQVLINIHPESEWAKKQK